MADPPNILFLALQWQGRVEFPAHQVAMRVVPFAADTLVPYELPLNSLTNVLALTVHQHDLRVLGQQTAANLDSFDENARRNVYFKANSMAVVFAVRIAMFRTLFVVVGTAFERLHETVVKNCDPVEFNI